MVFWLVQNVFVPRPRDKLMTCKPKKLLLPSTRDCHVKNPATSLFLLMNFSELFPSARDC